MNEADNCAISKEAVDRFSEEFFGRRIKTHQSVMGFDYVDGKYYPAGMDDHNFKTTHIQKFIENGYGALAV
ncbi:MAG: hypothetical protein HPY58_12310 [Firmicutes bacterium]|nr:hypothetical protein [Bacillota bacterium]